MLPFAPCVLALELLALLAFLGCVTPLSERCFWKSSLKFRKVSAKVVAPLVTK